MSKCIWITGATGFSGKHLIDFLRSENGNDHLIGIGRSVANPSDLDEYHKVDLRDEALLKEIAIANPPDFVVHLAGLMPPHSSQADMWEVNVGGTINLLRAIHHAKANECRVLIAGSAAEYSKNETGFFEESSPSGGEMPYGRTKWSQSLLALELGKQLGISVICGRVFNLIGPGLSENYVASTICRQFANPDITELKIGKTDSERDFIDIRDCVAAYSALLKNGSPGEIYNICSGVPTSINHLIQSLSQITGRNLEVQVDKTRFKSNDVDRAYGSNSKILAATGWEPHISLVDSLKDMLS